jgi:hypothetical protein
MICVSAVQPEQLSCFAAPVTVDSQEMQNQPKHQGKNGLWKPRLVGYTHTKVARNTIVAAIALTGQSISVDHVVAAT